MYHVYRGIVYTLYLLDVLVESHTAQLLLDYYYTRIKVSGEKFIILFTTFFFEKNVPGVLKKCGRGRFGAGGVWRRATSLLGVALGRKTMHFFLWLYMTYDWRKFRNDPYCLQKLSSGNLGSGRWKKLKQKEEKNKYKFWQKKTIRHSPPGIRC